MLVVIKPSEERGIKMFLIPTKIFKVEEGSPAHFEVQQKVLNFLRIINVNANGNGGKESYEKVLQKALEECEDRRRTYSLSTLQNWARGWNEQVKKNASKRSFRPVEVNL